MAGFTQARQVAILAANLSDSDYIAFSADGTTETTAVARVAVESWAAPTVAEPSVRATAGALEAPDATAAVTVTHFAVFSAATGGSQIIDWTALTAPITLTAGDNMKFAAGTISVSLA